MNEFDYKEAQTGAKVVTRGGLKVRIDNFDRIHLGPDGKNVRLIMGTIENGDVELWDKEGKIRTDGKTDQMDLCMAD